MYRKRYLPISARETGVSHDFSSRVRESGGRYSPGAVFSARAADAGKRAIMTSSRQLRMKTPPVCFYVLYPMRADTVSPGWNAHAVRDARTNGL